MRPTATSSKSTFLPWAMVQVVALIEDEARVEIEANRGDSRKRLTKLEHLLSSAVT